MQRSLTSRTGLESRLHLLANQPHLDAVAGKDNWFLDLEDPERRLIVACGEELQPHIMVQVLKEAGVRAEFITDLPSFC